MNAVEVAVRIGEWDDEPTRRIPRHLLPKSIAAPAPYLVRGEERDERIAEWDDAPVTKADEDPLPSVLDGAW